MINLRSNRKFEKIIFFVLKTTKMSLQPCTQLIDWEYDWEYFDGEDPRPSTVECPECNRYGKWSTGNETGITRLQIPCYECAKNSGFVWHDIPCNGMASNGVEFTNHDIVMKMIDEKYDECVTDGSIVPSYQTFTCMEIVFDNVMAHLDFIGEESNCFRQDLKEYTYAIVNNWRSFGSWPHPQERDDEHEIRFFRETYHNCILPDFDNEQIVGMEVTSNSSRPIIENRYDEEEYDEEYYDEEYYEPKEEEKKKLCGQGIEIIEKIRENKWMMNEGTYLEIMNIFKELYNV